MELFTPSPMLQSPLAESAIADFTLKTEATFTDNSSSQFDLSSSPDDDAQIYAALGFTFNNSPQLPVQRDAQGNPIRDRTGKLVLTDRAIAVSANYQTANVPNNPYSNLVPPPTIPPQTVQVPDRQTLQQQELDAWIPAGTPTQTFNTQQHPLNNARDWQQFFPANGTATQPTLVRVMGGGLTIPADVVLSHLVIIVEQGNLQLNGPSYDLNRVLLIVNQGSLNVNRLQMRETSLIASGALNFNQSLQCSGFNQLISGATITFNQATQTSQDTDNLRVIAQGNITANATLNVRAALICGGICTLNQPSSLRGYLHAKGDIRFNAQVTVIPAVIQPRDTVAPVIIARLLRDTAIANTNQDSITADATIVGQVSDTSRIVEFRAGLDQTPVSQYADLLSLLQADRTFVLTPDQLATLAGGQLTDGMHTLHLQAKDAYGNQSSIFDLSFILDTTTSIPQDLDLPDRDDTGVSQVDNITRINAFTITGTAEANAQVQLLVDRQPTGTTTASATGQWSIHTSPLADGLHVISAIATDVAGNRSSALLTNNPHLVPTSAELTLIIDTLPPQLTLTTPLDVLRDRARLSGTINGTGSAIVACTYQFDNLPAIALTLTTVATFTQTATQIFNQAIDFTGISNGAHVLTLTAVDEAGNLLTQTQSATVDLDHTAPVIVADLVQDTAPNGTVNTDRITFDPRISGTVSDANQVTAFQARFVGKDFTNILVERLTNGQFLLERSLLETLYGEPLPDGVHTVELQAQDEFGNLSPIFSLRFTLDTQTPVPTLALAIASDSGASASDRVTQVSNPVIQGTTEPNAQVRLVEANQQLGETIANGTGQWQITSATLSDGVHELRAIATDVAGNQAIATAPLQITVDSRQPQIITTTAFDLPLKRDARLIGQVNGTGSDITTFSYQLNAGTPIAVAFNATGNFDQPLDFTGLTNGTHTLTLTATDLAGNQTIQPRSVVLAVNVAPVITSQPIPYFPLTQQTYRYQIQASDADNDALRYQLITAPQGTTLSATGELRWVPAATVKAGDRGNFTVAVDDGQGGSTQQSFTVDVLAQLGTISGLVWNDANRNTVLDHVFVQGKNPVVVFVVDISGSTGFSQIDWTKATIEQVHSTNLSILDMEKAAIVALAQQMLQQGRTDIRFGMVLFNQQGMIVDLNPVAPGVQPLISVAADEDRNNIRDLIQALNFKSDGQTNFTAGLLEAEQIFTAQNVLGTDANIIFLSDGVGQLNPAIVTRLRQRGVNMKAFGIRADARMDVLQQIDPQAIRLISAQEITTIFSSQDDRFQAEKGLTGVRVYLDSNNNGAIDSQELSQLTATDDPNTLAAETGRFRFTDLLPGSYTVRIVLPTGFVITTPVENRFVDTVTAMGESFSHLFGLVKTQ
jgi:Bacterial Ig-like domain/von Willebrand factor type A domain/Bacterial Ig domain